MNTTNQTTMIMEPNSHHDPSTSASNYSYIYQMIISFTLISIQASTLHPTFIKSNLSKYIRISLTPINFYLFFTSPFRSNSRLPSSFDTFQKLGFGSNSIIFAIKSLEFGFSKKSYYVRKIEKNEKDGSLEWNQVKDLDRLKDLKKAQEEEGPVGFTKLVWWTILNLTSFRGLQFTFGPTAKANNYTIQELFKRLIKVSIALLISGLIILQTHRSPLQTPMSALTSYGIPNIWIISLISEWIHRISFGICLSSSIDLQFTSLTISFHFIHKFLTRFPNYFSSDFLELINPIYYPPIFNSPHLSNSLNDLWSHRWHPILKRSFLTLGGKPTFWFFNQFLGLNFKLSQLAGLIGTFLASGSYMNMLSVLYYIQLIH
ncbi:uncharacterized protein MELLADRAFT_86587 [Melampsora larici-populina 98AG31]|uniref:Wax synthase domain-containing protein n=1 Tax=Melampsora larici-populina (strain 98AG31 / pathotype 3-4-7) TaxID=747676 RepID=F4RMC2_MELLP|nr:uncharacterized protein MELLADRAFT_86587 [Melampsora larici-populina 98AG31]EGG06401.1 hypothetical protein MELLADRAFT_86587 [Melampsora larici-populina 98AG31]